MYIFLYSILPIKSIIRATANRNSAHLLTCILSLPFNELQQPNWSYVDLRKNNFHLDLDRVCGSVNLSQWNRYEIKTTNLPGHSWCSRSTLTYPYKLASAHACTQTTLAASTFVVGVFEKISWREWFLRLDASSWKRSIGYSGSL